MKLAVPSEDFLVQQTAILLVKLEKLPKEFQKSTKMLISKRIREVVSNLPVHLFVQEHDTSQVVAASNG